MDKVYAQLIYADLTRALVRPGIFLLFSLVFLWVWNIEKKRPWLLHVALASLTFAIAWTAHLFTWPDGIRPNAVFSGILYTLAVLAACEGMLLRADKRWGLLFNCALLVITTGLLWLFTYLVPSLWARIYIQNFGYGGLLLATTFRLRALSNGNGADRLLFWTLLGFSIQFFLRTSLTLGFSTPESGIAFVASAFWGSLQLSLTVFGSSLAFSILIAAIADMHEDLRHERDSDPLTGVLNRRGLDEQARRTLRVARVNPLSVVVCDIDHFKSINDTFGHSAGDDVLRSFAALLKSCVQPEDIVARTGGEEFTILLVGADEARAVVVANRMRVRFKAMAFRFQAGTRIVTASFGVVEHQLGTPLTATMKKADDRLYLSKQNGRNRVVGSNENDIRSSGEWNQSTPR